MYLFIILCVCVFRERGLVGQAGAEIVEFRGVTHGLQHRGLLYLLINDGGVRG